ncbi:MULTISPECIES: hypothetical protein [Bacillus mojavensis subgroup]|uniref:hypothetical protein n=1 Tax=Bacillus mojavensis subgroup TaxID=653388 RepID=UPI0014553A0C|nr:MULTISPECIES: hypothetical protein [Bacillus mojavensis subgroup]MEC1648179.1 hypothetical protein [Bacillus halotolerans]
MKYAVINDCMFEAFPEIYETYEDALAEFNKRKSEDMWDELDLYICEVIDVRKAILPRN